MEPVEVRAKATDTPAPGGSPGPLEEGELGEEGAGKAGPTAEPPEE